jgi:hypothetical protein
MRRTRNFLATKRLLSSDFDKQRFRIQIQKGGKVLLWNQVKSKMGACYSEIILAVKSANN